MSSREGTQRLKMVARQESYYCSTIDDLECFNYIDFGDAGGELGWVRSCGICSSMSKFDHASMERLLRQYAQLPTLGWGKKFLETETQSSNADGWCLFGCAFIPIILFSC